MLSGLIDSALFSTTIRFRYRPPFDPVRDWHGHDKMRYPFTGVSWCRRKYRVSDDNDAGNFMDTGDGWRKSRVAVEERIGDELRRHWHGRDRRSTSSV